MFVPYRLYHGNPRDSNRCGQQLRMEVEREEGSGWGWVALVTKRWWECPIHGKIESCSEVWVTSSDPFIWKETPKFEVELNNHHHSWSSTVTPGYGTSSFCVMCSAAAFREQNDNRPLPQTWAEMLVAA